MRLFVTLTAVFLVCLQVFAVDSAIAGDANAGAAKAKTCTACHNSKIDLQGLGADAIDIQSKAIRDGKKPHPPGLAGLSDEDIADIAAYLNVLD